MRMNFRAISRLATDQKEIAQTISEGMSDTLVVLDGKMFDDISIGFTLETKSDVDLAIQNLRIARQCLKYDTQYGARKLRNPKDDAFYTKKEIKPDTIPNTKPTIAQMVDIIRNLTDMHKSDMIDQNCKKIIEAKIVYYVNKIG